MAPGKVNECCALASKSRGVRMCVSACNRLTALKATEVETYFSVFVRPLHVPIARLLSVSHQGLLIGRRTRIQRPSHARPPFS